LIGKNLRHDPDLNQMNRNPLESISDIQVMRFCYGSLVNKNERL